MKKPRFYTGFLLLIGGNVWESNPPPSLTRDSGFEGRGAHQGHIRFQMLYNFIANNNTSISGNFGTPGAIRTHGLWNRNPTLYPAELRGLI